MFVNKFMAQIHENEMFDSIKSDSIKYELDIITTAIKAHCNPVAIYLFGSYAYGLPRKNSDLDIYIVVPDDVPNTTFLAVDILETIDNIGIKTSPLDLLVGRQGRFENRKHRLTLEKTIYNQGVKLHEYRANA
ncbi:MAG: nucleotidyltransferase domain-containing protein [Prevotellaceae bacterium]|jgi:predicted nucleotidyltransferase|nr:nucleotidyltransferase domain-containing protein [Prevotellaceae bacterium]